MQSNYVKLEVGLEKKTVLDLILAKTGKIGWTEEEISSQKKSFEAAEKWDKKT